MSKEGPKAAALVTLNHVIEWNLNAAKKAKNERDRERYLANVAFLEGQAQG